MGLEENGQVALVTGGAGGLGSAVARKLAARGTRVVIADVVDDAGEALAEELDGLYVHCDVRDLQANIDAVGAAVSTYGGLDVIHLNAGVSTGFGVEDDFDLDRYRSVMGINLDGVVFGVHAALPALRARGAGTIVATASLAGLTSVPMDPLYAANKHAVVGLVRSLGPGLALDGIRVLGLCPGFSESAIIEPIRELLASQSLPIIPAEQVADTVMQMIDEGTSGDCWFVQAGRESQPFAFRNLPGPRG